ncbi:MAG: hypothetical protein U0414_28370 [Polyangiaceae bacterium]
MSMQQSTATREGAVRVNTLREAIEIRRVRGERYSIREAVGVIVPLTTSVANLHAQGRSFFVHPSAVDHGRAGTEISADLAAAAPTHERDRACLAPELKARGASTKGGDARASVFALGAILYELVTGESVGPGMRRPSEIAPDLPPSVEIVLGKALVADPAHRPADLAALAQALHQLAPAGSMPPPAADVSHLDHDDGFDVDVSLSMIPPPPSTGFGPVSVTPVSVPMSKPVAARAGYTDSPFTVIEAPKAAPNPLDPTLQLAALKERIEGDPRPRWVAIKDGMDHGPFTGVELLQQIASGSFTNDHAVRDTLSNEERAIRDWDVFAPFAGQAKLNQDIKQERRALEAVVTQERLNLRYKALIGVGILSVVTAALLAFFLRDRGNSKAKDDVKSDQATAIDSAGSLAAAEKAKAGTATGVGGPIGSGHWDGAEGTHPILGGGMSCAGAKASYVEDYNKTGKTPDIGAAAFGAVLNNGSYLNACGVPMSTAVTICVAAQNGRAVGVTVTTNPSNPSAAACIDSMVRGMSFPSGPRLDVATTTFAAQ